MSEDIACIGLDRIEALDIIKCKFNYIERDAKQMGRRALGLLSERIQKPDGVIKQIILTPSLRIYEL